MSLIKRWLTAALSIIMTLACAMTIMAEETDAQIENHLLTTDQQVWNWQEDSGSWKYISDDGEYKRNVWEKVNGYWYFFDNDGHIVTDWKKISGMEYSFSETGELNLGWCYNDEEETWHYYDQDGTAWKGWLEDDNGNWYWFSNKGEMASSGYKYISGNKYYFFDDGKLAANRYVGLYYMDENGLRNEDYDIIIEGNEKVSEISSEVKEAFTEASQNIPREWVKKFTEQGWEILYYPDKQYFSAPLTGTGPYYICHKLDTSYKKIKICNPEELTEAFGEYIGYTYGCYDNNSQEGTDLLMNKAAVDTYIDIPDYFADDLEFYFGKLSAAYLGSASTRSEMEEDVPEVTSILKKIFYSGA